MLRVKLDQGSYVWQLFRKGKLTASKAPIIMGLSPYQTPFQLFEEELGLRDPQIQQEHMKRGLEIEDTARQLFYASTGIQVEPAVVMHPQEKIFIASLDGLNNEHNTILEIKRNNKEYHEMARSGKIPDHYFCQIQHQLYVTELKSSYYMSYRENDPLIMTVSRDDEFIEKMVKAELEFKEMIENLTPPPTIDRDYEDFSHNQEIEKMVESYYKNLTELKIISENVERQKEEIKSRIGEKNAKGKGWKLTRCTSKGRVMYEKIDELKNLDLEPYRKPMTTTYRLTVNENERSF